MTGIKISHSLAFLDSFVEAMIEMHKKQSRPIHWESVACLEDIRKILQAVDRAGKEIDKKAN